MTLPLKLSLVGVGFVALLAGCSSNPNVSNEARSPSKPMQEQSMQDATESERLGTQWGDDVNSQVTQVDLRRTSREPIEQMQVSYADKNYTGRALNSMSLVAGKVDFAVATDRGNLPLFRDNSNYYLQGQSGQAYRLIYKNNSKNTYEIVASVDGLNVLNGSAASRYDSGYVLSPNEKLVIEGFRKSQSAVASFIFSKPENAYAANTTSGSIDNTGIIGTVVYEIYNPNEPKSQASRAQAFPADDGYAKAPQ